MKILCRLFGHKLIKRVEFDNGRSILGEMVCQRCGYVHDYQYDYMID